MKRDEATRLAAIAAAADLAIVADEVFAAYAVRARSERASRSAAIEPALTAAARVFSLGGLSKSCGLPHLKLGWIVVGGPDAEATLAGLELIADTYLSVAAPVQQALPELFALGAGIRAAIAARVAANRTRPRARRSRRRRRARCCRRRPAGRRSCGCRPSAATRRGPPGW